MQGMVCAVEQEFCSAGDGTELSDPQPVSADGGVVQHIVFLEIPRIMDKIVAEGERPDSQHFSEIRSAYPRSGDKFYCCLEQP